jgi:hypothetical protein
MGMAFEVLLHWTRASGAGAQCSGYRDSWLHVTAPIGHLARAGYRLGNRDALQACLLRRLNAANAFPRLVRL